MWGFYVWLVAGGAREGWGVGKCAHLHQAPVREASPQPQYVRELTSVFTSVFFCDYSTLFLLVF